MSTFSQEKNESVREKRKQDYLAFEFSLMMALAIGAEPNTCFDNVLAMFKYFPEVFASRGKLIEGWYVVDLADEVVINEHGWCELPFGKIIDPTVILLVSPEIPVYYFPGVERTWWEVKEIAKKRDVWFPYVRGEGVYGEDGLGHPAYKAAYQTAMQKVFSLACTHPPKKMTFLTANDPEDSMGDKGIGVQMFIPSLEQQEEGQRDE